MGSMQMGCRLPSAFTAVLFSVVLFSACSTDDETILEDNDQNPGDSGSVENGSDAGNGGDNEVNGESSESTGLIKLINAGESPRHLFSAGGNDTRTYELESSYDYEVTIADSTFDYEANASFDLRVDLKQEDELVKLELLINPVEFAPEEEAPDPNAFKRINYFYNSQGYLVNITSNSHPGLLDVSTYNLFTIPGLILPVPNEEIGVGAVWEFEQEQNGVLTKTTLELESLSESELVVSSSSRVTNPSESGVSHSTSQRTASYDRDSMLMNEEESSYDREAESERSVNEQNRGIRQRVKNRRKTKPSGFMRRPLSSGSSARQRWCSPDHLIPRVLADSAVSHSLGVATSALPKLIGPVATEVLNAGANEAIGRWTKSPSVADIYDRCIGCYLDEALGKGPCDENWGDPHLVTRDGLKFDFQGAGDYLLVGADDFQLQARYARRSLNSSVSILRALAVETGVNKIIIGESGQKALVFNGNQVDLDSGDWIEFDEGFVHKLDSKLHVFIEGKLNFWTNDNGDYLVRARVDDRYSGRTVGLLGDGDGVPGNDLKTDMGGLIDYNNPAELYGEFLRSWLRTGQQSLFDSPYSAEVDGSIVPESVITSHDLTAEQREISDRLCSEAGFLSGEGLEECIFDIAVTGDEIWLASDMRASATSGSSYSAMVAVSTEANPVEIGNEATVTLNSPAAGAGKIDPPTDIDRYHFTVPAGESRVFSSVEPSCDNSEVLALQITFNGVLWREQLMDCSAPILLPSGDFEIAVFGHTHLKPEYAFTLSRAVIKNRGAVNTEDSIEGSIDAFEINQWSVDFTGDPLLYFRASPENKCSARWRLLDGNGAALDDKPLCEDLGPVTLKDSEEQRLQIYQASDSTDYSFHAISLSGSESIGNVDECENYSGDCDSCSSQVSCSYCFGQNTCTSDPGNTCEGDFSGDVNACFVCDAYDNASDCNSWSRCEWTTENGEEGCTNILLWSSPTGHPIKHTSQIQRASNHPA